jgi:hypothetical protein
MMTAMARMLTQWGPWEPARPAHPAPIASLGSITADGIPYLAPEIQLFYKAKAPRSKDETDFTATLPILTEPQQQWLSYALSLVYGPGHPWHARLLA